MVKTLNSCNNLESKSNLSQNDSQI